MAKGKIGENSDTCPGVPGPPGNIVSAKGRLDVAGNALATKT